MQRIVVQCSVLGNIKCKSFSLDQSVMETFCAIWKWGYHFTFLKWFFMMRSFFYRAQKCKQSRILRLCNAFFKARQYCFCVVLNTLRNRVLTSQPAPNESISACFMLSTIALMSKGSGFQDVENYITPRWSKLSGWCDSYIEDAPRLSTFVLFTVS